MKRKLILDYLWKTKILVDRSTKKPVISCFKKKHVETTEQNDMNSIYTNATFYIFIPQPCLRIHVLHRLLPNNFFRGLADNALETLTLWKRGINANERRRKAKRTR